MDGLGTARKRGGGRRRAIVALLAALAAAVVALALVRVGPPPRIEIEPARPGIGPATQVVVRVDEPGRGLSGVTVELVQGERRVTLAERSYRPRPFWAFWGPRTTSDEITFEVGRKAQPDLEPGEATLRVAAGRAPTWLRHPAPAVAEKTLPVRFTPPSLAVTSTQINVAQGGCEAVVYQVGPTAARDGVAVGEWWFPGYPLPGGGAGEHFSLFAAPYDLEDPSALHLVVEDELGNRTERPFVDRYDRRPMHQATLEVSDAFMARVVPAILAGSPQIKDRGDLLANYLAINGELRRINGQTLRELAAHSQPEFLWTRPFRQLPNSKVMAAFADRRTYRYQGRVVDHQDHLGFDLASVEHAPVLAANRGVVTFAGDLGIYGNAVVLDHGYGLATLYAHLSHLGVEVGAQVEAGQELGRSGETGLAGGDHLHFSVLLQGLPVTPLEWWDRNWIRDHLAAKLGPALPFTG
jgi:murein DD-endopeptidase MepM/ murein hydrolase activator NlpD